MSWPHDDGAPRRIGRGRQGPTLHADDQRGSALVITVLVCLAMTGLALVAVSSVTVENRIAHNQKLLKQANYVAETGMMLTMQRLQAIGATSLERERERLKSEGLTKKISFDLNSFGVNSVYTKSADPTASTLGIDSSEINFVVEVDSLRTAPPPAGYQVNLDQSPQSLEVGLISHGSVGRLTNATKQDGTPLDVNYSERRVWALVPVP